MTTVALREVEDADLPLFFAWQGDEESHRMAAVPPRDEEAFAAHWERIRANPAGSVWTVVADGEAAGFALCWDGDDGRSVGYWIGFPHWGRGIASEALRLLVDEERVRPLVATVAAHNLASQRVLEKAGFLAVGRVVEGDGVEVLHYRLDAPLRQSV